VRYQAAPRSDAAPRVTQRHETVKDAFASISLESQASVSVRDRFARLTRVVDRL